MNEQASKSIRSLRHSLPLFSAPFSLPTCSTTMTGNPRRSFPYFQKFGSYLLRPHPSDFGYKFKQNLQDASLLCSYHQSSGWSSLIS